MTTPAAVPASRHATRRGNVLVVEDHRDTREMYAAALEAAGFACRDLPGGAAVVQAAVARQVKVVILDLALTGELDGFEIARRLRALPVPPRIIAVTGRLPEGSPDETLFDEYLVKPCAPSRLVDVVLRLVP